MLASVWSQDGGRVGAARWAASTVSVDSQLESFFKQSEDLVSLIEAYHGKGLKLYVYNTQTDSCREVVITPNGDWGGEGR